MKYLWIVFAALLVSGECGWTHSDEDEEGEVTTNCVNKDVDAYLDNIVEKARHDLPDPMRLPPRSAVIMDLTDGLFWGMSGLKRVGKAKVVCDGDTVTINLKLTTLYEAKGRYTWKKKETETDRDGFVLFVSRDFRAEATIVIDKKEGEVTHPQLTRFLIRRFKDAKIEITGDGLKSWALSEITTLLSGVFQRAIAYVVQDPVREAIERQLHEVDL